MTKYNPMRELPAAAGYGRGDVLVLFGELFGRGYANGIVEEAKKRGMTIIGSTVGRRASDGKLRPLNAKELTEAEALLDGTIINVPLEAGFDMTEDDEGRNPIDHLKRVRPDDWDKVHLDWAGIGQSRRRAIARFTAAVGEFSAGLARIIPPGAHVLFVHTMAGGMPRSRIYMPVFNRVFKGQGERFLSSETFWTSELGKLCALNFTEVTADTFNHLIDGTAPLREQLSSRGAKVSYAAYGYHGCEVLIDDVYTWQSYIPYLPGWAKISLEEAAAAARSRGVPATVFNSPEIQTNSSALFMGVEISLYPLLAALGKEGGGAGAERVRAECRALLRDDITIEMLLSAANEYLSAPDLARFRDYASWPHHNTPEQADLMLDFSSRLFELNRDQKNVVCAVLSRAVFTAAGKLMLDTMWESPAPVFWLNHDIIAKRLAAQD